ncbi:MAG TPA: CRISPR-associated endonuclease Cas2 [Xanthomonadaceae bacterium]|nr:CRISPR-associated endonuclease Cas2 [Xanthomonadaceae bacterium]
MFILVAYDVPAERTVIFHKLLARYLVRMQFSVFAGDLKDSEKNRLMQELEHKRQDQDRLMLITCQNRHNIDIEVIENCQSKTPKFHKGSLIL